MEWSEPLSMFESIRAPRSLYKDLARERRHPRMVSDWRKPRWCETIHRRRDNEILRDDSRGMIEPKPVGAWPRNLDRRSYLAVCVGRVSDAAVVDIANFYLCPAVVFEAG